jgi:hypothetical protein
MQCQSPARGVSTFYWPNKPKTTDPYPGYTKPGAKQT